MSLYNPRLEYSRAASLSQKRKIKSGDIRAFIQIQAENMAHE